MFAKLILAFVALAVASFSAFGFLASFEEPGLTVWKIGYPIAVAVFGGVGLALIRSACATRRGAGTDLSDS